MLPQKTVAAHQDLYERDTRKTLWQQSAHPHLRLTCYMKFSRVAITQKRTHIHHIVPTTPRKPAKTIVAAMCNASSGMRSSPFAVSHALRNASEA